MSANTTDDQQGQQELVRSPLQQLLSADNSAAALACIRDNHVLERLRAAPEPLLPAFLRLCAARGLRDVFVHAAVVCPGCLDARDGRGRTALFWAAYHGHLFALHRLLDAGADARVVMDGSESLLHVLAQRKVPGVSESFVARILGTLTRTGSSTPASTPAPTPAPAEDKKEEATAIATTAPATAPAQGQTLQGFLQSPAAQWLPESLRNKLATAGPNVPLPAVITQGLGTLSAMFQQAPDQDELPGWQEDEDNDMALLEQHWAAVVGPEVLETKTPEAAEAAAAEAEAAPKEPEKKTGSTGKEKHVDWTKFMDEGALSSFELGLDKLLAYTVRRLCRLLGRGAVDARNARGETPLDLARRCKNTLAEKCLRECGAAGQGEGEGEDEDEGRTLPPLRKQLNTREEYVERVRAIIDMQPRHAPMAPRPYVRGRKYRVLSMDGGGIRCLCHPTVLRRVLARFPDFLDTVSMFCGCSGSSPVAAGFALGLDTAQIKEVITLSAVQTLSKKEGNQVTGFMYTSRWNRTLCDIVFGETRMRDLPRAVVVPAFLIDNGRDGAARHADSLFLTNAGAHGDDRIADVCLRSGSAPTYFRCYQGYVDGGVFANNPSACGIAAAAGVPPNGYGADLRDIVCLSLGTGFSGQPFFSDESVMSSGGIVQWGMGILDLYDLSQRFFVDNNNRLLLGDRYFRFMPQVAGIKLDNIAQIDELNALAETMDIQPLLDWIEKYWYD